MRKCGIVQIEKLHYKGNTDNPITKFCERNKNVHELANRLKHRQYLENDNYLLYAEFFNVLSEGYNSDETKVHVKLDDIQGSLMKYHKDLIGLAKELLIPIHKSISNAFID